MSTKLNDIINRMNVWTPIYNKDETLKVLAIDESIRGLRRMIQPPWVLKKSTLRVFEDVLVYPIATDHAELAYIDNQTKETDNQNSVYESKARFRFTSLQEFYENPDYRNDLAEIWDTGTKYLGIRYQPKNATNTTLNNAETLADWTGTGDAGTLVLDTVVYKEGNGSIRVPITSSTGTATVSASNSSVNDSNYKRKYFFIWVYLDSAPTSLTLRYGNDSSNYLYSTVTTQFSGQAMKADDWNLFAMDLNTASTVGTITSSAFDYQAVVFTGASTGTYYVDASYLRQWELMDYYYYSIYNVVTALSAYKTYFYSQDSTPTYDVTDLWIGDDEWCDVIGYDAASLLLTDEKEQILLGEIKEKRDIAWGKIMADYPDMKPLVISTYYRHGSDYQEEMIHDLRNI
jgi:hypothetical protein